MDIGAQFPFTNGANQFPELCNILSKIIAICKVINSANIYSFSIQITESLSNLAYKLAVPIIALSLAPCGRCFA
jgi:hypothetical protein